MDAIHTLQEYMVHTENVTYILIVIALIAIAAFWYFLTEKDED